jgi:HEAT repeat protein
MGLIKGKPVNTSNKVDLIKQRSCAELIAALDDSDAMVRRHAAQKINANSDAATALISRLKREKNTAVREAILNSLLRLHDSSIDNSLVDCLRSEDAALRNDVIEAFKQLGDEASPILRSLLDDPDPDVRIFVINILNCEHYPDVEQWLIKVIEQDAHVNVCATAVDLLCEVGTEAASDPLLRLKARFAHEAYIQFAADLALKRIREI